MSLPVTTYDRPRDLNSEVAGGVGNVTQVFVMMHWLSVGQAVGWTKAPSLHRRPNWPVMFPVEGSGSRTRFMFFNFSQNA